MRLSLELRGEYFYLLIAIGPLATGRMFLVNAARHGGKSTTKLDQLLTGRRRRLRLMRLAQPRPSLLPSLKSKGSDSLSVRPPLSSSVSKLRSGVSSDPYRPPGVDMGGALVRGHTAVDHVELTRAGNSARSALTKLGLKRGQRHEAAKLQPLPRSWPSTRASQSLECVDPQRN
jgi:hypothetical protein